MALKDIAKKWGKIAMCGVTLLGATGGILATDNGSSNIVQAATISDNVITFTNANYETEYADTWFQTESINGTFIPGEYFINVTFNLGSNTLDSVQDVYINGYGTKNPKATVVSKNGNTVKLKFTLATTLSKMSVYVGSVSYGGYFQTWTSKPYSSLTVTMPILDEQAPVLEGYQGVYYTNYDSPKTIQQIISGIKAIDETDGEVTVNITEDNYTGSESVLGSHIVKLSASDAAGNTSTITIDVIVVDATAPTISGVTSYTSNMSSPVTESTIRSKLSVSDNYDNSLTINLVKDNFTGNEQKAGSYTIEYNATDSSGNVATTHVVTITNKDDIKPTITGTSTYNVSSTGVITSDYIISQLIVNDNIDSNLIIKLVNDGYTENSTLVGTYQMKFNVTDNSGNVSDVFTVNITVNDDIPPVFWVSNEFFSVDESLTLTHQQIVDILLLMNNIETTEVLAYQVVEDNYTANPGTPGVYAMSYRLQMSNGEVITLSSEINVVGEEVADPVEPGEKIEQETKNFFENVWDDVKEFFNKIWKSIVKYIGFGFVWDKEGKFEPNWSDWN